MPGALPFTIGCLFAVLWAGGSMLEYASVDVAAKFFWFRFQSLWRLPVVISVTCFVVEYAWPGRWLTRRNVLLLSIPYLLSLVLIPTNNLHHWLWAGFVYAGEVVPLRAWANWLLFGYGYGLTFLNLVVLAWLFLRSPQHRWPVVIMVAGQSVGRFLYLLEVFDVLHTNLRFDMPQIAFEYLMYTIALFGFRIFDERALARQMAIAQMQEAMLALDLQGQVTGLNPAAQAIFAAPTRHLLGRQIVDLVPEYAAAAENRSAGGPDQVEVTRGTGSESRDYLLATSDLIDWRGLVAGRLLLMRDVTEEKQIQTQLVEQQRALAILQERERLARELHDSIGQVLGYASFQVEAASKLVLDGQTGAATAQLDRLARVVRDAHADVREYILNLNTVPVPQMAMFAALRQYLDGFTHNYNIQTLLSVDERLSDEPFPPDTRMQVFRILQEAMSNARKHAGARSVQVTFALEDHFVRMTIQDDGAGFDPDQSTLGDEGHFGLRFMRERAEALGGSLDVISKPGQGTGVVTRVPIGATRPRKRETARV